MAVDNEGVVYVTDSRDGCVQKFSISGQFIEQFGTCGFKRGELALPYGVAVDDKGYVHISEASSQRISIFTSRGEFVHCFIACSKDEGSEGGEKRAPGLWGVAIDKNGNLYASYTKKGQVVIF